MSSKKVYRLTGDGPATLALVDVQRLCTDPDYRPPTRRQLAAARYRDWLAEQVRSKGKYPLPKR